MLKFRIVLACDKVKVLVLFLIALINLIQYIECKISIKHASKQKYYSSVNQYLLNRGNLIELNNGNYIFLI
jgi:hypothetical protein